MEQLNLEKRILYYYSYKIIPNHWEGFPIIRFKFKDLKTSENVILEVCFLNEELSKFVGKKYYKDIIDATKDYDILWNLSPKTITPLNETFEEVQREYRRMFKEGVPSEEINEAMLLLYSIKQELKKTKKIKI